jgi:hypothetical protein
VCALVAAGVATVCLLVAAIASRPLTLSPTVSKSVHAMPARHPSSNLPDAARATVAQAVGGSDPRFFVRRVARGFASGRGASGLVARFARGGVVVRAGGIAWSLGLRGFGRAGRLDPAAAIAPTGHGNRVRYERRGVSEWYANGPWGLEQGFTLASRPVGAAWVPVTLALGELPRGVRGRVSADRRSLALTRGGIALLRYRGLFASDARGRALPARIVLSGGALSLRLDDRAAVYPVRVDPFVQVAKLTASDAATSDAMGISVAISGDTIVAGAPRASGGPNAPSQGAVYVFVEQPGGWATATETAKLTASDGAAADQLGSSVAISGDTIVAGAPHARIGNNGINGGNADQGAAYVFVKPAAGGWVSGHEQAKLVAADGTANDLLASSVAISGATVVAGAFNQRIGANQAQGAAYVFVKPVGGWGAATPTQAKLTASDGAAGDDLGGSVAISGDTVVATRVGSPANGRITGAEYVFVKPPAGWSDEHETAKLTAAGGGRIFGGANTGEAVAISGATIVGQGDNAVYVFVKPAGGWSDTRSAATLTASDGPTGVGWSMAISGDTVVSGAPQADIGFGAVYVFSKPPGGWADEHEAQRISGVDNASNGELGYSVGVDGSTIVASAPFEQEGNVGQAGAAYVFAGSVGAARPTSSQVSCSPPSVAVGQATTCTATVTDTGPNPASTPTGTVTFASDSHGAFSNPGASCTLNGDGSCHVDYTPSAADSGTHQITGSFGGDGAHAGSTGNTNVTVAAAATHPTSTSLSCSPGSVTTGHATTCGATVSDTANGPLLTPTGTVQFGSNSPGTFSGGSCTLTPINAASSGCIVHYTPTSLASGTDTLTGAYGGDGAHAGSIGRASIAVITQPVAPVNTALPSIHPDQSCQFYLHRFFCQTIPYQYFCNPGTWAAVNPAVPYQYEWEQLYHTQSRFGIPFWRAEPNGSGQTFYAQYHRSLSDIANGYMPSGFYRCVVTATGRGAATTASSPATQLQVAPAGGPQVPRPAPVNIVVTGIEVTQAVQSPCLSCPGGLLPARDQSRTDTPGQAPYYGVTMAAGKWTVVRVYAHVTGGTPATLSGATAQLDVLDSNGNRISTLNPDSAPAQLTQAPCNYCVTPGEAANPGSSFNFLIPWQETNHRSLTFRATVTPRIGLFLPGQCGGCRGNTFTLSSVPFIPTATVPIYPVPLTVGSAARCGTSLAFGCTKVPFDQVFGDTTIVLPEQFEIHPYRAPLQVPSSSNACQVAGNVSVRDAADGVTKDQYGIGVFFKGQGSMANGCTLGGYTLFNNGAASAVQDTGRSLTSVTHEIGHGLGLVHADTGQSQNNCCPAGKSCPPTPVGTDNCGPHPDGTPDCGGSTNGQTGENWPPGAPVGARDDEGRLDSWGLDRRSWDIFRTGSLPGTYVEGFGHDGTSAPGTRYYDLMSYCPAGGVNDSADWISQFNWNRLLFYNAPANNLPAAADRWRAVPGTPLRVMAIVDSNGKTSIVHVVPGQRAIGGPTPGSPYRIEVRDRSGHVLDSVVPITGGMHIDHSGQRPELLLDATLPFIPATGAVDVSAAGQEIARRVRSAHAPTVKFLSPRPGSQLGKTTTTVVHWSARDADGDRVTSMVEYSLDGGRHWTVVADGVTGHSARVPSRFLSASRNARLRVLVSDGFDVTTATSGRLRSRGVPPTVQILSRFRRGHVLDTATLLLQGSAFDDANRPLTGRHLKWYLGKRLIGTGERVTLTRPKAGNTVIRLVATDSHGRSSQATLPLQVKAVPARYLLFDAPLLVSRHARVVKMRIAASGPATFTIAGKRYAVSPRMRTITVRVRRGKRLIRLPCSLRSRGGVIRETYIAIRQ